ncbi:hypothetical protein KKH39_04135 [Patescibacteria group bacterium]|nr:hypothetical protein [Patescibacteria group bacterium]
MKKLIITQFYILLAGTLFAWGNFGYELKIWLADQNNEFGCTPGITNPFLKPCFYGAIFFTIAFILSAMIFKKSKK